MALPSVDFGKSMRISPNGNSALPLAGGTGIFLGTSASNTSGNLMNTLVEQPEESLQATTQCYALIDGAQVEFESLEAKFNALVEAWEDHQTGRSVTDYDHSAYTQIIGMGQVVTSLLLGKLSEGDGDWIFALKMISGEEAETPDMYGDPDRVIQAWLNWGQRNDDAAHEG